MSLQMLHEDLVRMVIEEIAFSAPKSLLALRQVSKTIESLASPAVYGSKTMTSKLLTAFIASQGQGQTLAHELQVVRNVTRFTRHLVIEPGLEESTLVKVLTNMEKLYSLRWPYWKQDDDIRREAAIVAAVVTKGATLRVLHLWQLSDDNIETLAQACSQLEELTIQSYDLPNLWSPKDEFKPLTMFGKLETLLIFTKFPKISPFRNNEFASGHDACRANVQNWVEILVSTKQGTPFKKIVASGKTRASAPLEEWRQEGHNTFLNALYITLPIVFTYEHTSSETEVDGTIEVQEESH